MSELEVFNKLVELNPNKGVPVSTPYIEKLDKNNKKRRYYLLPDWITGKTPRYSNMIMKSLIKLGISMQVYYDIVVLGLTNINQRPKCKNPNCDEVRKFGESLSDGYNDYCSQSCFMKEFSKNSPMTKKGHKKSESHRSNISNSLLGREFSESHKLNISISHKNPSPEYRRNMSLGQLRYISSPEYKNSGGSKRYKHGSILSTKSNGKFLSYLSSWEMKFIMMMDKDESVVSIDNCPDRIPYRYKSKDHLYIPDFTLILTDGSTLVIEIKPKYQLKWRLVKLKYKAGLSYYTNLGITYLMITEDELFNDFSIDKLLTEFRVQFNDYRKTSDS